MATGLRTIPLPLETIAGLEVNRKIIMDYRYVATMVSTQAQPIAPEQPTISATATKSLVAGTRIANLMLYVTTAFVGPTTLTVVIGDDGSTNRFMATGQDLKTTGWKQTTLTPYQYIAANTVDMILTGGSALTNATAGQLEIYFLEADPNGLRDIEQPM